MLELDAQYEEEFDDHIDLTPLIDVIFMLLVFFIMATTFLKPVINIDIPEAESGAKPEAVKERLILTVDKDGGVFHKGELVEKDALAALIGGRKDLPVNLFVDKGAPFQSFMFVLDQARLQGKDDVSITTIEPEEQPR